MDGHSQVEIRKGIPVPPDGRHFNVGSISKYPWRFMAVGDSFLFPVGEQINRASAATRSANNRLAGMTFVCRTLREGPDAGRIGCWRVS